MVMVVVVPMTVVMIVIVVMLVVMMVIGMIVIPVGIGIELLWAHFRVRHLGEFEDIIHSLVLENRRPELGEELGVAAVIVVELALLARKLPHALQQRAAHLLRSEE